MFRHLLRDQGAALVDVSSEATGFGEARLYDGQNARLFRFGSSAADHWIRVDRGAGTPPAVNRVIIPEGHNVTGSVHVEHATSAAGPWSDVFEGPFTSPGAGELIDESFTDPTSRWMRVRFAATGQWELGELFLTDTRTTSRGVTPDFSDDPERNETELVLLSGASFRRVNGPTRRRIVIGYADLPAADRTLFDDLYTLTGDGAEAFWLDGPDDAKPAVYVKLQGAIDFRNDSPAPTATGIRESARLELLEAVE